MPNLTRAELDRVLALEAGGDADAAFAELILGWERGWCDRYAYSGDFPIPPSGMYAIQGWTHEGETQCTLGEFQPTQGDAADWWLGVEKLRERGIYLEIHAEPAHGQYPAGYGVLVSLPQNEQPRNFSRHHANPAIALLRAAAQALYATQQEQGETK